MVVVLRLLVVVVLVLMGFRWFLLAVQVGMLVAMVDLVGGVVE